MPVSDPFLPPRSSATEAMLEGMSRGIAHQAHFHGAKKFWHSLRRMREIFIQAPSYERDAANEQFEFRDKDYSIVYLNAFEDQYLMERADARHTALRLEETPADYIALASKPPGGIELIALAFIKALSDEGISEDVSERVVASALTKVCHTNLHQPRKIGIFADEESQLPDILYGALRLQTDGKIDHAMDFLFREVDALLKCGEFEEVDAILDSVEPRVYETDLLITLLTSTLGARSRLKSRSRYFEKVDSYLRSQPGWDERMLRGLGS